MGIPATRGHASQCARKSPVAFAPRDLGKQMDAVYVMDPSLLPFVQVAVGWASEHRWRAEDSLTGFQVPQYALWLVLDGAVTVWSEGRVHLMPAGTACLLPANIPRDLKASSDAQWLSIGLTANLFGRIDVFQAFPPVFSWQPEEPDRFALETWMRQVIAEWIHVAPATNADDPRFHVLGYPTQPRSPLSVIISEGLGRAMFGMCWRALDKRKDGAAASTRGGTQHIGAPLWLSRTLEHVAKEPQTPVHALAPIAALSPAQFRRAFHAWVGVAPQTYVTRARLDEARRLLLTTDLIISVVAERVGFASLSYFTRLFKQQFGVTPAQFRKMARQPSI